MTTEVTHLGSSQQVQNQKQELEKHEAWMLMELQKLRRQIENCELRMAQRTILQPDQGASQNLSVRINELEVCVDLHRTGVAWLCVVQTS